MIPSSPTVTWPNHHSIATGVHPEKHGVLTNGRFVRDSEGRITREMELDRYELSTYPTLYDLAFHSGLITGAVNWPVTRNTKTLHFDLSDAPYSVENATSQLLSELLEAGILEDKTSQTLNRLGATARDYAWTLIASHILRTHKPNVMLFHL
jgi:predicted AlkP superfamily pyrophosphatase or phosphodiesterase